MPSIVWKGRLTFGLVSIPIKLHSAVRKERANLQLAYCPLRALARHALRELARF